jgi:hypothetical protein
MRYIFIGPDIKEEEQMINSLLRNTKVRVTKDARSRWIIGIFDKRGQLIGVLARTGYSRERLLEILSGIRILLERERKGIFGGVIEI